MYVADRRCEEMTIAVRIMRAGALVAGIILFALCALTLSGNIVMRLIGLFIAIFIRPTSRYYKYW